MITNCSMLLLIVHKGIYLENWVSVISLSHNMVNWSPDSIPRVKCEMVVSASLFNSMKDHLAYTYLIHITSTAFQRSFMTWCFARDCVNSISLLWFATIFGILYLNENNDVKRHKITEKCQKLTLTQIQIKKKLLLYNHEEFKLKINIFFVNFFLSIWVLAIGNRIR